MDDERAFCPLCGDNLDKHRKLCQFEGTVHGSDVVHCRYTGDKAATCLCVRCGFDRSIVKTCTEMLPKEPERAKPPAKVEGRPPEVKEKTEPVSPKIVTRMSLDLV
jgi:hypothetical protein